MKRHVGRSSALILSSLFVWACQPDDALEPERARGAVEQTTSALSVRSGGMYLASELAQEAPIAGQGQAIAVDGDTMAVGADGWVLVYTRASSSAAWVIDRRISIPDGAASGFGAAIALQGDVLVVGSPDEEVAGQASAGRVRIYERGSGVRSWDEIDEVYEGQAGQRLGSALSMFGGMLAIGAPGGAGEVFLYKSTASSGLGNWVPRPSLTMSPAVAGAEFGAALSFASATRLWVGAPSAPAQMGGASDVGAAFAYEEDLMARFELVDEVHPSGGAAGDRFGAALYAAGDHLIVGAPLQDSMGTQDVGAVHLFIAEYDAMGDVFWDDIGPAMSPVTSNNHRFGSALFADSTGLLVVGAPGDASSAGAAYRFMASDTGATYIAPLARAGGAAGDGFGGAVVFGGPDILIGAPGASGGVGEFIEYDSTSPFTQQAASSDVDGPFAGDQLGVSVAVSGDWAVVGAPDDRDYLFKHGAAFVFRRGSGGWEFFQRLEPVVGGIFSAFGESVAIDGDLIVVGAPEHDERFSASAGSVDTNEGAAFVYKLAAGSAGRWELVGSLRPSDLDYATFFGERVDVDATTRRVVVGAPQREQSPMGNVGAVFVYDELPMGAWSLSEELRASDAQSNDRFGHDVAIDGDVIVASELEREGAYIFHYNSGASSWDQVTRLDSPGNALLESWDFGRSVGVSGARVVVGARDAKNTNNDVVGAALVYERDPMTATWSLSETIFHPFDLEFVRFGEAVDVDGDVILVGASSEGMSASEEFGAAYLFTHVSGTGWGTSAMFVHDNPADEDEFGAAVGLDGNVAIVGAPGRDVAGEDAGAAYVIQPFDVCTSNSGCDPGEVCDTTSTVGVCEPAGVCGNGVQETGEACDDGATISGDGCDSSCLVEAGGLCGGNSDCETDACVGNVCVCSAQYCGAGFVCDANVTGLCLLDSDSDGVGDVNEYGPGGINNPRDTDQDTTPDYLDPQDNDPCAPSPTTIACLNITDSDGDGYSDQVESGLGLNSMLADTDGDGLCDGPADPAPPGCVTGPDPTNNGTCVQGFSCELAFGEACVVDDQCGSGNCFMNACVECSSDTHCAVGSYCPMSGANANRCVEPSCGNGVVESGEACDGGEGGSETCSSTCSRLAGESCELDAECDSGDCTENRCAARSSCGDGTVDDHEQCDDGNVVSGDGCDSECDYEVVIELDSPAEGAVLTGSSVTVAATVTPISRIEIFLDDGDGDGAEMVWPINGEADALREGDFEIKLEDVKPGAYTLQVSASYADGPPTGTSASFKLLSGVDVGDSMEPVAGGAEVYPGDTIGGTATEGDVIEIEVAGEAVCEDTVAGEDGRWSCQIPDDAQGLVVVTGPDGVELGKFELARAPAGEPDMAMDPGDVPDMSGGPGDEPDMGPGVSSGLGEPELVTCAATPRGRAPSAPLGGLFGALVGLFLFVRRRS